MQIFLGGNFQLTTQQHFCFISKVNIFDEYCGFCKYKPDANNKGLIGKKMNP